MLKFSMHRKMYFTVSRFSAFYPWVWDGLLALTVALAKRENRTLCQHYCAERQAKVKCIAGSGTGSRNTTWSQNLYTSYDSGLQAAAAPGDSNN